MQVLLHGQAREGLGALGALILSTLVALTIQTDESLFELAFREYAISTLRSPASTAADSPNVPEDFPPTLSNNRFEIPVPFCQILGMPPFGLLACLAMQASMTARKRRR